MKDLTILEQLCFSTTRIETEDYSGKLYSGTGFFFNLKIGENTVPIVVTNKHVVQGMSKVTFLLTESDTNGNPILNQHFRLINDDKMWIIHPNPNIDLCVCPFNMLVIAAKQAFNKTFFYRCFDNSLIPNMDQLSELDVVEDVLMIGYPDGLWDYVNNMPIIRRGITATDPKINFIGENKFLIDIGCIGGSSGSPIILLDKFGYMDKRGNLNLGNSRLFLLGILCAGYEKTVEGNLKVVPIPTAQIIAPISQIPTNLGIVIKSNTLLEFIPLLTEILKNDKPS